jgi:hypothetical protein
MGRNPRLSDASATAGPRKQLGQRRVAERLMAVPTMAADQKHEWARAVARPMCHHVLVDRRERRGLVQIDHAFESRLCASALRMIIAVPDHHAAATVTDVLQMQTERLAWAKSAVQHQSHERYVTPRSQRD